MLLLHIFVHANQKLGVSLIHKNVCNKNFLNLSVMLSVKKTMAVKAIRELRFVSGLTFFFLEKVQACSIVCDVCHAHGPCLCLGPGPGAVHSLDAFMLLATIIFVTGLGCRMSSKRLFIVTKRLMNIRYKIALFARVFIHDTLV